MSNLRQRESGVRAVQLGNLSAAMSGKGLQVAVQHALGKAYLEIIRKTLNSDFDLVVKPATRDTGIKQRLMGSADIQLLSLCATPVWIVQSTANRLLNKIAVAVDLQPVDAERSALANEALNWGKVSPIQLARTYMLSIHGVFIGRDHFVPDLPDPLCQIWSIDCRTAKNGYIANGSMLR